MSTKYVANARKILCIGRNYAAHIQELNDVAPLQPFFFLKPSLAILAPDQGPFLVPRGTSVQHEVELAVVLNRDLKNLPETFSAAGALESIAGYALSIDMTARNVQDEAKKKGLPWTIAKGFDTFLPLSRFVPKEKIPDPYNVQLELSVNGEVRQSDKTKLMLFPIHKILSHMSCMMTLQKGDIILTGTPKGVGIVRPGDKVHASMSVDGEVIEELGLDSVEKDGPYIYKET